MKMEFEHYLELQRLFIQVLSNAAAPSVKEFWQELVSLFAAKPNVKDASMAARWRVFHVAYDLPNKYSESRTEGRSGFLGVLYSYLDDSHIETALKSIVKELEK